MNYLLQCTVALIIASSVLTDYSDVDNLSYNLLSNKSKVLSRRKRFLTFPEGSSFQLVFCVQTSALITIGDIFLYGNTAALAWTLPTDAKFFKMIKDDLKPVRRSDTKEIYYLNKDGAVVGKKSYKRKPIINPVFAKRSIEENMTFKERLKIRIENHKLRAKRNGRDYLKKENMDKSTVDFHRQTRAELYEKIEKLLTAMGRDGRQCVLRKLCDANNVGQEAFLQELLAVVFTLPKGDPFIDDHHKEYDTAYSHTEDCETKYPGCINEEM